MKVHGQFFRQQYKLALIDIEVGHKWLHSAHLKFDTESLICAAQEQALATNVMKSNMRNQGGSSFCRLLQNQDETIMHIFSGCEMVCEKKYLYRRGRLAHVYTG